MTIISGNAERARLIRESSFKRVSDSQRASIFRNGSTYKDLTEEQKYIAYKLNFLSPTDDSELYFVLETLFNIDWNATDYQLQIEENMVEEIFSERRMFFNRVQDSNEFIRVTGGDILIYWAKKLAFDIVCSVATACEMLLDNLGLGLPIDDERYIYQVWGEFELSDCMPNMVTMFDQEYYEFNASFYSNGRYLVPDWWDQYQSYLVKLVPYA